MMIIVFFQNSMMPFSPFSTETAQVLDGLVHGEINGVCLDSLSMHTYVSSKDGRTYTAISQIPSELGPALETLSTVGGGIGWLFALTSFRAYNGSTFTGKPSTCISVIQFYSNLSDIK